MVQIFIFCRMNNIVNNEVNNEVNRNVYFGGTWAPQRDGAV